MSLSASRCRLKYTVTQSQFNLWRRATYAIPLVREYHLFIGVPTHIRDSRCSKGFKTREASTGLMNLCGFDRGRDSRRKSDEGRSAGRTTGRSTSLFFGNPESFPF
jgi:hypothetical protein